MDWLHKLLGVTAICRRLDRLIAHEKHTHEMQRWQIEAIIAIHQHYNSKHCDRANFTSSMPQLYEHKTEGE